MRNVRLRTNASGMQVYPAKNLELSEVPCSMYG